MSKEQIEEMAYSVCRLKNKPESCTSCMWKTSCNGYLSAESYYNAGYRKQSDGEWKKIEVNGKNYGQVYYQHKECKVNETQIFPSPYHLCPNCGAKMKGDNNGKSD